MLTVITKVAQFLAMNVEKLIFFSTEIFFFFNFVFLLRSLKCKERESVENIDYKLQGEHFNCCFLSVLKLGVMYLTKLCQEVVR